jgi:hypothetical protein
MTNPNFPPACQKNRRIVIPEENMVHHRRERIYRQLTHHMRTFSGRDVWGETFNPWQSEAYKAEK